MARALIVAALAGVALAVGALAVATPAHAQPGGFVGAQPPDTSAILRAANAAAVAGNWPLVAQYVNPLVYVQQPRPLSTADQAEANRLAGLAAFFLQQLPAADARFLDYLRLDPDAHLDPSLYPPEAVSHFEEVRARHAAEMRVRRSHGTRYPEFCWLPLVGQYLNGDHAKAYVTGGVALAFLATNISTFYVLRHYCNDEGSTCDADGTNHRRAARDLQTINIAAGIGMIGTLAYSVYDGIAGYRRETSAEERELQPFAAPTTNGAVFGVGGHF